MNIKEIMNYLKVGPACNFTYGIVREEESILAFGVKNRDGSKVRIGSISAIENGFGNEFLVLSIDNNEEFRAQDRNQLYWFLWKLEQCKSWEIADAWANERWDLYESLLVCQ